MTTSRNTNADVLLEIRVVANFERGDSYVFQRAKKDGLILVFNQDSYLMASIGNEPVSLVGSES